MKTLLESILPAQKLGIEVLGWANGRIELTAPLLKNLNDKGTAFAGSIDSLLDLAGWSAITLALRDTGINVEVMIVKSETAYRAAVRADMTATAELSRDKIDGAVKELKSRGRSRISVQSHLTAEGARCATMTAHYAIISPERPEGIPGESVPDARAR